MMDAHSSCASDWRGPRSMVCGLHSTHSKHRIAFFFMNREHAMFNMVTRTDNQDEKSNMMKVLDYAYEKATTGGLGLETAIELAEDYLQKNDGDPEKAAESLISWQIAKAGTAGFLSGMGGLITLPVAIPANIAAVVFIQIRMSAAIAHMGGYNLQQDQVKTFVYMALTGNSIADIAKDFGIKFGVKVAESAIKKIPGTILMKINQAVGFRLVTKAGSTGLINMGKLVPFLGGAISGAFDSVTTRMIGKTAKKMFITEGVTYSDE
ncbi:EcsC family protein [Acidithiobacillus concretivorus]|nr:EcsC family protein [Acidithiobacillus concretivorus]